MHQCFREQPGSSTVVMYSSSEEGVGELANMLVNDERSSAILVADECSLAARVRLSRRLESCKHRIRCICIDNSTERAGSAAPEFAIVKPSYPELLKILEANFPRIPGDRLRAAFGGVCRVGCRHVLLLRRQDQAGGQHGPHRAEARRILSRAPGHRRTDASRRGYFSPKTS